MIEPELMLAIHATILIFGFLVLLVLAESGQTINPTIEKGCSGNGRHLGASERKISV